MSKKSFYAVANVYGEVEIVSDLESAKEQLQIEALNNLKLERDPPSMLTLREISINAKLDLDKHYVFHVYNEVMEKHITYLETSVKFSDIDSVRHSFRQFGNFKLYEVTKWEAGVFVFGLEKR